MRTARCRARLLRPVFVLLGATACATDPASPAPPAAPQVACPEAWVPTVAGGCAPAVVACAPGAHTASRTAACATAWPVPARTLTEEGATGQNLFTLDDREIGGAWLRRGEACIVGTSRDADGACVWPTPMPSRSPRGVALPAASPCPPVAEIPGARYIDARAEPGGDGTRARPFDSVTAALAAGSAEATLVFAEGTHDLAPLVVTRPLRLQGACARAVTLRFADEGLSLRGNAAVLTAEGLSLEARQRAVHGDEGATADLTGVVVRVRQGNALEMNGATLNLRQTSIESPGDDPQSCALQMRGGRGTVRESALRVERGTAIMAVDGANLELDDVALRGVNADDVLTFDRNATLTARALLVEGGQVGGLSLARGSTARLEGAWFRGLVGSLELVYRSGSVVVQRGSSLVAREVLIEGAAVTGLALRDAQTTASVDGLVVRDLRPGVGTGRCVDVNDGARATLRRVALRRCHDAGLMVAEFARVDLRDASIREVAPNRDGLFGFGLTVLNLGHLDARRVLITGATMGGIGAIGIPAPLLERAGLAASLRPLGELTTTVRATDVVIREGAPLPQVGSFAFVTAAGVDLEATRVAIVDAPGASIAVTPNGYPTEPFLTALVNSSRISPGVAGLLRRVLPPNLDGASSMQLTDIYVRQGPAWRVGFDPLAEMQPNLRASIGTYVGRGCSLDATRLSIDSGAAGEYALANHGAARVTALRASAARRCTVSVGSSAQQTLLEGAPLPPPVCRSEALDLVRLPLSPE